MAIKLMIGDWVHGKSPIKTHIGKVAEQIGTHIPPYTYLDIGDNYLVAFPIDKLSPIPITDEILAKNFEKHSNPVYGESYDYSTDFQDVSIKLFEEGVWEVKVDEVEFTDLSTSRMYVSNVHQLQQALRLACVDKEIVL